MVNTRRRALQIMDEQGEVFGAFVATYEKWKKDLEDRVLHDNSKVCQVACLAAVNGHRLSTAINSLVREGLSDAAMGLTRPLIENLANAVFVCRASPPDTPLSSEELAARYLAFARAKEAQLCRDERFLEIMMKRGMSGEEAAKLQHSRTSMMPELEASYGKRFASASGWYGSPAQMRRHLLAHLPEFMSRDVIESMLRCVPIMDSHLHADVLGASSAVENNAKDEPLQITCQRDWHVATSAAYVGVFGYYLLADRFGFADKVRMDFEADVNRRGAEIESRLKPIQMVRILGDPR